MKSEQVTGITEWFDAYAQSFAGGSADMHPLLRLKLDHSRRVAKEAEGLAQDLGWNNAGTNTARALGLLHDVGRFSQFAEYRTFSDAASVNHGQRGCSVVAQTCILDSLAPTERNCILDGIRHHNARNISVDLSPDSLVFLKLIRDADKLDIFLIVLQAVEENGFRDLPLMLPRVTLDRSCSPEITKDIQQHHCCSLENVRSLGDFLVMQLSWVFDLNYTSALRRFSCRRIIPRILRQLPENSGTIEIGSTVQAFVTDRLNSKASPEARRL